MTKNRMKITEEEILSDDGIFAASYSTVYDNAEKCCYCGCPVMPGEEAMQIYVSGDVIHSACWQEYAEENTDTFGKSFVMPGDGITYFC